MSSRDELTQARAGAAARRSGKRAGESLAAHTAVRPGVSLHEAARLAKANNSKSTRHPAYRDSLARNTW